MVTGAGQAAGGSVAAAVSVLGSLWAAAQSTVSLARDTVDACAKLVPPSGDANQLEFSRKHFVKTQRKVFLHISGDWPPQGKDRMNEGTGGFKIEHGQAHQTRGECAIPEWFEAKHIQPTRFKKGLITL